MPQPTAKKGNRKAPKKDQPKRIRYNAARRGYNHRLRDLRRHLKKHPNDVQAAKAMPSVEELAHG